MSATPPSNDRPARGTVFLAGAVIALAALAAYANSFAGAFVYDDLAAIGTNPTLRTLASSWHPPAGGLPVSGRPLLNFSFALNRAIGGANPAGYHAVNLGIHLLAALTLFGLVRRTLLLPSPDQSSLSAALPVAFLVALLWAVHPLQTESVTYLSQRAESLAGLFVLLTLYGFNRFAGPHRPPAWALLGAGCALAGVATKETAAAALPLVLLYDRCFTSESFRSAWARHRWFYLGLGLSWLLLAALIATNPDRGGTAAAHNIATRIGYLSHQAGAIVRYLTLSFWPHPLIFDYGVEPVTASWPGLVGAVAVVLLLAVLAVVAFRPRHPLGFASLAFFVLLAPSSSLVPILTEPTAEHRMYLPLAAVLVVAVAVAWRWLGPRLVSVGLATAVLFGALTALRNRDYRSELALWCDTVAKRPANARAHFNLAVALAKENRTAEAIHEYEATLQLRPALVEAHVALGNLFFQNGDLPAALDHYEQAVKLQPARSDWHDNLATVLDRLGRAADAFAHYRQAIQLDPHNADACFHLGNLLARHGRFDDAIAAYRQALAVRPDFGAARDNLARAQALASAAAR